MICYNCGVRLHTGEEKECQLCGAKFALRCISCGFPNPSAALYCFNCGSKLAKSPAHSSVLNFGTLSESRRNVAVIFADISGFTALSEKLDPEEVREIINECFNNITKPIYELEGTIDKYIGDCVMALFGATYPHVDDAKRAVLCAIKMLDSIREFSEHTLLTKGAPLTLSIGINYGLVVTGGVGNYFDKDYTVIGDIVNTAQRLQTSAGRGSILVSESVYNETKSMIDYSDARDVTVKNKENPVRCYQPVRVKTHYSHEAETVFVEREKETGALNSVYNSALNAGMHCVTVIGEAGIGKTRLLKEFVSKIGSDIKKVWVDCNPIYQSRAYYLISNVLMNIMNINASDTSNMKRHRLISFLDYVLGKYSDDEIRRNYDFLSILMGLDREAEFKDIIDSMSFEDIRREILKQLNIFFSNLCEKHMLLITVDDAQWADSNSMQLLKELIAALNEAKIYIIFSTRYPLELFGQEEKQAYKVIKLNALKEIGVRKLSLRLLNCQNIDDKLFDTINRLSRGNPLYLKELVSSIKRAEKFIIRDGTAFLGDSEMTTIPNNIQSLILSNFYELDEGTRNILQAASVIGNEFSLSVINHLMDDTINEKEALELPVRINIIELKSVYTSSRVVEKVYVFCHELEREVIYESILNRNRKELHKNVAEYLEVKYPQDIENYYEILCVHFHNAGMEKKALEYYYKTALKHQNQYDFAGSLGYFNRFLKSSDEAGIHDSDERIFASYREMGYIYSISSNYDSALEHLSKALQKARSTDEETEIKIMMAEIYKDEGMLDNALAILSGIEHHVMQNSNLYGRLLQMKCCILHIKGDPQALELARKSEKVLLKAKDYQNLSETMKYAGLIYFATGDIQNALSYTSKSYKYAEKINNLEMMARVSGNLGIIFHYTGAVSKALEYFNKTMEISKKISYIRGYVAACINLGILYLEKGCFDRAEELFKESRDTSRETSSKLYECACLTNLGDISYEKGAFEKAQDFYMQSVDLAKRIKAPVEEGSNYIGLAKLKMEKELYDDVPEILEKAGRIFEETSEATYLSDYYLIKGTLELHKGNVDPAMQFCEKAISTSEECKSNNRKLKALRFKGYILMHRGEFGMAAETFNEVITLSGQIESDYESAKGYYGLFMIQKQQGINKEAGLNLKKAFECIDRVDKCRWTAKINEACRELGI